MYSLLAMNPDRDPFMFDKRSFDAVSSLEWIGSCSMMAIGWLVASKMYGLTVNVR